MNISDLSIGNVYTNNEIMDAFECAFMGGMRRSKKTNTLVLVFDHTKRLYDDCWDGNVLHYTGMGKTGDQVLKGNQNKTLYESDTNGVHVHLFEVFHEGRYTYQGEVKLAGKPYKSIQKDENYHDREVWIFPLIRK